MQFGGDKDDFVGNDADGSGGGGGEIMVELTIATSVISSQPVYLQILSRRRS